MPHPSLDANHNRGASGLIMFTVGSAATDDSDRFIYNQTTGGLFFNTDSNGAASQMQFATLSTNLTITNSNIVVF